MRGVSPAFHPSVEIAIDATESNLKSENPDCVGVLFAVHVRMGN